MTPRKEGPLSFQNPSFSQGGPAEKSPNPSEELIPVHLANQGKSESHRHLFDELESEVNYLQESLALPRTAQANAHAKDDMTRHWLAQHQIHDTQELIEQNEELEQKCAKQEEENKQQRATIQQLQLEQQKTQDLIRNSNKQFHGNVFRLFWYFLNIISYL